MTWNDTTPRTCHCDICDAPPEPACVVCRADGIDLDDWGLCAECRPLEEESCEAYEARIAPRRVK
jgi:hypothetical protein